MEIPVINFADLEGEKRSQTMATLHHACEKWGFFQIENHGIDKALMDKVQEFVNIYYEEKLKDKFYESHNTEALNGKDVAHNSDWESSFFLWHRPKSNIQEFGDFSKELGKTMDDYIEQLVKVAEKLAELISENLGLEKDFIKKSFSGEAGPAVGTKVAKYPECPKPELVRGLREHTDAGGIILLLQDDQVPGLEFFYNPAGDAIISPAPKLLYPNSYRFQDYLQLYAKTKFLDKAPRFESMKTEEMANGKVSVPA